MNLKVPEFSLILLIGISGSGKSSFASRFFKKTEIVSSDECRAILSNDENNQVVTPDAFALLHFITARRLKNGLLTVIDATNLKKEFRKELLQLANRHHAHSIGIVFNLPESICIERNLSRKNRIVGADVIFDQKKWLSESLLTLKEEGFQDIYFLNTPEEVNSVTGIEREKNQFNKMNESGPFDIIGDVHGCLDELIELLEKMQYKIQKNKNESGLNFSVIHPQNRKVIFLGDLVDRGPNSPGVLRLVMSMVRSGIAYCVPGNHDFKFQRYLAGRNVKVNRALEITIFQMNKEPQEFKKEVLHFLETLPSHFIFDEGRLVVAHAGLKEEMQGQNSDFVHSFCLYGETNGEIDEYGLPVRINWAKDYKGKAKVVYGHTPVSEATWFNNTIDIDTGCVFGGQLTALRYPENELLFVNAKKVYFKPRKPFL